jgi:hypothetical protein
MARAFSTLKLFYARNIDNKNILKVNTKAIRWRFYMPKIAGSFLKTMGKTSRWFLLGMH